MKIASLLLVAGLWMVSCNEQTPVGKPVSNEPLFSIINANQSGIFFENTIPESAQMNSMTYEYYYNGGGVSIGDVNKDGLPDLFFTGNITPNKLYLNLGNLRFKDITEAAGVKDSPSWTTGSTMVDINDDGIMDIYVCRSGKLPKDQRANLFFVSDGLNSNGLPKYRNQAGELGLDDEGYGTQAIFLDYDRDNDLDMYLLNHNVHVQPYYNIEQIRETKDTEVGDKLFRNDNGRFKEVTEEAGIISNELGYGLGVSAGDVNNDGWVDLYVANDYSEHDFLYINQGDGTFKEEAKTSFGHMSNYSMGSDIADINNDGLLDIAVLDMLSEDNYGIKTSMSGMNPQLFDTHVANGFHYQYMHNTLQLNRGNLKFSEIARLSGISSTDWSWAPLMLDLDLDGLQDLFVTNGLKRDFRNNDYRNLKIKRLKEAEQKPKVVRAQIIESLVNDTPQRHLSNYVFKNMDGVRFEKRIKEWGIDLPTFSNGLSYGDLDNDGDLDLVVNNIDVSPIIYQNKAIDLGEGAFIKVRLSGPDGNSQGIGSRVYLYHSGQTQIREMFTTRGYQSSVEPLIHFGLSSTDPADSVQVVWSDGKSQVLKEVSSNQLIMFDHSRAKSTVYVADEYPLFHEYVTSNGGLQYRHQENNFDDFHREVLLPHRMSRLGPGLDVGDFNGDGLEDVFVGGASGQAAALFIQQQDGNFVLSPQAALLQDSGYEDMDALFFDADADNDLDLYVVSGGNEVTQGSPLLQDRLYLNFDGQLKKSNGLPRWHQSGGIVRPNDFDNDGDLDLFLGNRQIPGHYPYSADSWLLVNQGGTFTMADSIRFDIGMVTDMVWADYDQDGDNDMVVVGEWMPITFIQNDRGKFSIDQEIMGTENSSGWWYSIEVADFDRDGDLDFMLGNNGLNYKYQASDHEPFEMYSGDLDNDGNSDIVLGYYNEKTLYPLRGKECSTQQIPGLKDRFSNYHSFAIATLEEVYEDFNLEQADKYQVFTFASMYLESMGNKSFKMRPLPREAQFSAGNQILVGDFNNDHHLDAILAGNNHQSEVETTRNDAGMGTLLLGNGKGAFSAASSQESGLYLNGDLRDMAWLKLGKTAQGIISINNNGPLEIHLLDERAHLKLKTSL